MTLRAFLAARLPPVTSATIADNYKERCADGLITHPTYVNKADLDAALLAYEQRQGELRAALVGLVGVDNRSELEAMEAFTRSMPAPNEDKAAMINAIHVLIATLPSPPQEPST